MSPSAEGAGGAEPGAADLARFRAGLRRAAWRQGRFERVLRGTIRAVSLTVGWRVEVRGPDDLPLGPGELPGGGCVVAVAPHRAWIDPFLLVAAWPPDAARLVWVGEGATMVRSRWRRWLLPRLGMIPVGPGTSGPRATAELAAGALASGAAVVIFPEKGPPSAPAQARTIAPGFAYVALRSGAPVLPVVLGGTHRIVRGSRFTVDLLEPIEVGGAIADPFQPAGRAAARALTEALATVIAAALPERTAQADTRRPDRDRWRWMGTLFR